MAEDPSYGRGVHSTVAVFGGHPLWGSLYVSPKYNLVFLKPINLRHATRQRYTYFTLNELLRKQKWKCNPMAEVYNEMHVEGKRGVATMQ